jgi:hypothetical protein
MDRTDAFVDANTAMRRKRDPIALTLGQNGASASKQIICLVAGLNNRSP